MLQPIVVTPYGDWLGGIMNYTARNFGAKGDGQTNDTEALQKAIDTCAQEGGTLVFEKGTYLAGTLLLKSNIGIYLEKGATLKAFPDIAFFKHIQPNHPSRMDTKPWRAWLYAEDQENILLDGEGKLDGCGGDWELFPNVTDNDPNRPYGIHFVNCTNVTVKNLRLQNSAFWMQRYLYCKNIRLENLDIWNHSNQNNDGIDVDSSEDVFISNCRIDASDDGICLKSEGNKSCKNVVITNCIVATHASAIKLGTASVAGFQNISISNCVIKRSESKTMYHPLEAWGGLAGIDLGCVDGGLMENINISNIAIEGVETPIFIWLGKRLSATFDWQGYDGEETTSHLGKEVAGGATISQEGALRGITISGVTATKAGPIPSIITGYEGNAACDITLRDIHIRCSTPGTEADLTAAQLWDPERYPCNRTPAHDGKLDVYGLYIRHVDNLFLDNLIVTPAKGEVRQAMKLEAVTNLRQGSLVIRDLQEQQELMS